MPKSIKKIIIYVYMFTLLYRKYRVKFTAKITKFQIMNVNKKFRKILYKVCIQFFKVFVRFFVKLIITIIAMLLVVRYLIDQSSNNSQVSIMYVIHACHKTRNKKKTYL